MKGARASTHGGAIKRKPGAHRKTTRGMRQRFPFSLRQMLSANSGIEVRALPKTTSPRWIFPLLRIISRTPSARPVAQARREHARRGLKRQALIDHLSAEGQWRWPAQQTGLPNPTGG